LKNNLEGIQMKIETKLMVFYIGLNKSERKKFESIVGKNNFEKIRSGADFKTLANEIEKLNLVGLLLSTKDENFDIAVMQVVRHIVKYSNSNIELAKSIDNISGKRITRPEKRTRTELQGILLEELLNARKESLILIRNELMNKVASDGERNEEGTNLDKWFSIILGR